MSGTSIKNTALAGLESFAANTGDEALQARVEELRGLANAPVTESPDKMLVAKLAITWAGVYGDDRALWPEGLRGALEKMVLPAALQNLRLKDETYPAFEVGVAVVAPRHTAGGQAFMGPDSPMNRATTNGIPAYALNVTW